MQVGKIKSAENHFTTETRRTLRTEWDVKLGHYHFLSSRELFFRIGVYFKHRCRKEPHMKTLLFATGHPKRRQPGWPLDYWSGHKSASLRRYSNRDGQRCAEDPGTRRAKIHSYICEARRAVANGRRTPVSNSAARIAAARNMGQRLSRISTAQEVEVQRLEDSLLRLGPFVYRSDMAASRAASAVKRGDWHSATSS